MPRLSTWFALAALCACSHALATTITVDSTDDNIDNSDFKTTLREAITAFNASAVSSPGDTIAFNIPGAGVHLITPATNLPNINKPVFVNGYSQPGSSPNTNALNAGINAVVLIEIAAPPGGVGLQVLANGTTIRGIAIHGYRAILVGASDVVIAGNFIGTNAAGTTALPGLGGIFGVQVFSYLTPSNNVRIGGQDNADRNLIVPAGDGINYYGIGVQLPYITPGPGTGYVIQGNYIGTDISGKLALSGGLGLSAISNANVFDNLISGNPGGAVVLIDNDVLQGNLIGTQRDGTSTLPNRNFGGIQIQGGNSVIGYGSEAPPNVIAHNTGYGIVIYNGSTESSSNINTHNQFAFNSIYDNGRLGISVDYSSFVLANDLGDTDSWALPDRIGNDGQNYPVITSATANGSGVIVGGTLNSNANDNFALQFFANAACDASGYGQGQTFIGSTAVTTDASGNANFGPLSFNVPTGQAVITSTAEDLSAAAYGNTSEFSKCMSIQVGDLIFKNGFE